MKRSSRALWLVIALAVCSSPLAVSVAQELPLEKSQPSGTWPLEYAGQHFRVTSTVPVKIKFELLTETLVKIKFISETGLSGRVSIYWVEFEKYIYSGPIPTVEPWEGTLDTEGGFVDR